MSERSNVLIKALSSSTGSKLISFLYQVISLPILIGILGAEKFGALAVMMSIVGWINLLSGGVSPYVTRVIASGRNKNLEKKVIDGSRSILLLGSSLLFIVFFMAAWLLYEKYEEYIYVASLLFLISLLTVNLSLADSVRQGNKQQHINNFFMIAANIGIISAIFALYYVKPAEQNLLILAVLALYLPLLLSKAVNYCSLLRNFLKGFHWISYKSNRLLYRGIYHSMAGNLMIQLSVVIIKSLAIVFLSRSDMISAGKMEIIFRYLMISGTFFASIQLPLWPLITEARRNNDHVWLSNVKKMLGAGFFLYGLMNLLVINFFGSWLFEMWLGSEVTFTHGELILAASYFLVISLVQAPIIILMGEGKFAYIGKITVLESILYALFLIGSYFVGFNIDLVFVLSLMVFLRLMVFLILFKCVYLAGYE